MDYTVIRKNITEMTTDAVVLPANSALMEGRGVSTALFQKAGRNALRKTCQQIVRKYGKVPVGLSVATPGYSLSARYIVHAVVPQWIDGNHNEYALLSSAYISALDAADSLGCESITFPLLASGNNGFDLRTAAEIAVETIQHYNSSNKLEQALLIAYSEDAIRVFNELNIPVHDTFSQSFVSNSSSIYTSAALSPVEILKEVFGKFYDTGSKMFMNYINNEENREKIIRTGINIVNIVLKKVIL